MNGILSVDEFMFLLVWLLDARLCSIDAQHRVGESVRLVERSFGSVHTGLIRKDDMLPGLSEHSVSHSADSSAHCRLVHADQFSTDVLKC